MATTYNFTVRAEDDQGAFADRDFSIVVKNTSVDRYMIVDGTDAYTSPDMETWTKRIGQGGHHVAYGGGKWMIHYGASVNNNLYRLSPDGINFTNHSISFEVPDTALPATGVTMLHSPVWNNGFWWVAVAVTSPTRFIVIKSADGVNWTAVASLSGNGGNVLPSFVDGKVLYRHSTFTSATNAPLSTFSEIDPEAPFGPATIVNVTLPSFNVGSSRYYMSAPYKFNDMWIMHASGSSSSAVVYSTDRITWYLGTFSTPSEGANKIIDRLEYHNGVLFSYGLITGSSTSNRVYRSENGKDWTVSLEPSASGSANRASLISAKGKMWYVYQTRLHQSSDLGKTWTTATTGVFPVTVINSFATIR